jgi:hypothetical protein
VAVVLRAVVADYRAGTACRAPTRLERGCSSCWFEDYVVRAAVGVDQSGSHDGDLEEIGHSDLDGCGD